jgi:hypothetical protein
MDGTAVAASSSMRHPALPCVFALVVAALSIGAGNGPVRCGIAMRNVSLHLADGVVLDVKSLDGEFISRSAANPPVFDDPRSYTLRMQTADVSMDAASLTNLLRQSLATHPSPLSDVTLTIENGFLKAKGKLKKGVTVPFSMTAAASKGW